MQIAISQGKTPKETLSTSLNNLGSDIDFLRSAKNILLIIDAPLSHGHPASVNPQTLISLIQYIQSINNEQNIYVLAATINGVDESYILEHLGLASITKSLDAIPITYDQLYPSFTESDEISSNPSIDMMDSFIFLNQLTTDPMWSLFTSFPFLMRLKHPKSRWTEIDKKTNYSEQWINQSKEIYDKYQPALYINDAFNVLEGNGPYITKNTNEITPKLCFCSINPVALDQATLQHFSIDLEDSLINTIKLKDTKGAPILISSPEKIQLLSVKRAITDPKMIYIRGLTQYIGKQNSGEIYQYLQFLYFLETYFVKDSIYLGDWAMISGAFPENLMENGKFKHLKPESILIFGDSAINTTLDYDFQGIIKKKVVLSDNELQHEIIQKKRQIRTQIEDGKAEFELKVEEIKESSDLVYQERTILEEEFKLNKKIAHLKKKQDQITIKLTVNNEIKKIQNQRFKFKRNKQIIHIFGDPPLFINGIPPLFQYFKKYNLATLWNFYEMSKQWFSYETQEKETLKSLQEQISSFLDKKIEDQKHKVDLKKEIKELVNQSKMNLSEIKAKFKESIKILNGNFKNALANLSNKNSEEIELKPTKTEQKEQILEESK